MSIASASRGNTKARREETAVRSPRTHCWFGAMISGKMVRSGVPIDVRTPEEFAEGHIEGAVSLLDTEMTEADLATIVPEKDTTILFYCNGVRCLRSTNAIAKAKQWGYTSLVWFRGGWKEWSDKRLPVVTQ